MYCIYTDGSCSGNPGPGGYGAVILQMGKPIQELSGRSNRSTNNRMEMAAAIVALRATPTGSDIILYSDSKYVVNGASKWIYGWISRNWRTAAGKDVKNKDLWIKISSAMALRNVQWKWVKGHAGNKWNERCDLLARGDVQPKDYKNNT